MPEEASILSHIPNSGIVHLPGRRFPEIVLQGDTLSGFYDSVLYLLEQLREQHDEEHYYEVLALGEQLRDHLLHYEATLSQNGFSLPYSRSIADRPIPDEFDSL